MIKNARGNIFFCILFLFFGLSSVSAVSVDVNVSESSSLVKLLNGQYSLTADGVISVHNPSNVSTIYELNFPLELDALIGVSKVDIDNSSANFDFSYNKIKARLIEPNSSIQVGYRIYGLIDYDIYEKIKGDGSEGVLDYYVDDFDLVTNIILNLEKPIREDIRYNPDGTLNMSESDNSSRLVTCRIRNPTDFDLNVRSLKVYRAYTGYNNSFFDKGELIDSRTNIEVEEFGYKEIDLKDTNSNDSSVYWLASEVLISTNLVMASTQNFRVQRSSSGGGSMSFKSPFSGKVLSSILVKKNVDKTLVMYEDEVEVSLRIINVNDFLVEDLVVNDVIPAGFEIVEVDSNVRIKGNGLSFNIDNVSAYETVVLKYRLKNEKEDAGITYLAPARVDYGGEEYFSDGVLLIHNLLANKKIFIQKEVEYEDENFAKVTITVKNLGSISVEDLLVADTIDEDANIKHISQLFFEEKKGIWRIKELKPGEEWEVTYIVERNSGLGNLPNIFGVDEGEILGTLIFSEEVITVFGEGPRIIEKVGLGVAIGLLVFYLLF